MHRLVSFQMYNNFKNKNKLKNLPKRFHIFILRPLQINSLKKCMDKHKNKEKIKI